MQPYDTFLADHAWAISFWGSLVSTSILLVLVILRLFHDRQKDRRNVRRKEMQRILMIHMENPLSDLKAQLLKRKEDTELLAETALPMLRSLKGTSHDKVLIALVSLGVYDWLEQELSHRRPQQRIHAVALAPYWPDNRIKPTVEALLYDTHRLVRQAALGALASMQDSTLFPEVVRVAQRDNVSCPLMYDIFHKFGKDIAGALVRLAGDAAATDSVRMAAIMSLGTTGHPAMAACLTPLCSHASAEMRALAYRMFVRSGEAMDDQLLVRGMQDTYWKVRLAAAEAAATATPLPAEPLSALMADENWLVSLQAARAMYASTGGKRLLSMLSGRPDIAGKRAAMFLAEQGAA